MTIKKPQKVGLYVHVSPSVKEQLVTRANEEETSISYLIRCAIKQYLKNNEYE